jgi:hypothetical protein
LTQMAAASARAKPQISSMREPAKAAPTYRPSSNGSRGAAHGWRSRNTGPSTKQPSVPLRPWPLVSATSPKTYPEFVQMIELRELKAAQMREYARRGRQVIAEHPDWQDNPSMTLAEVLGVSE